MRLMVVALGLALLAAPAQAQKYASSDQSDASDVGSKFRIQGAVLFYNSDNATGRAYPEIDHADVEYLRALLNENANISIVQLTSSGGFISAGREMARIVQDYGLNTRVHEECNSACVTVFLAGKRRSMTPGSRVGFHQNSWNAEDAQSYYKEWRESSHWRTPFDFISWMYQDTQHETAMQLSYMLSRGVDPTFAIETKMHRPTMWFPERAELEEAGILRD